MERFHDQAYVLHVKAYRETSAIVKVFSSQYGIISGVLKGVYNNRKQSAQQRSALQIGNKIDLQWQGGAELKTLYQVEPVQAYTMLSTKIFFCLSYIHELLMHLLPAEEPAPEIFHCYQRLLLFFIEAEDERRGMNEVEKQLRCFELDLLHALGYGIDFLWDTEAEEDIKSDQIYTVVAAQGIKPAQPEDRIRLSGKELNLINDRVFDDRAILKKAKTICRLLLDDCLGGRKLKTRQLYREMML